MARLVPTGRDTEVRLVLNPTTCGGCGGPLKLGLYRPILHPCEPHGGHCELACKSCGH